MPGAPPTSPEQVRRRWDALLNVINNVSADGSTEGATTGGSAAFQSSAAAARDLLRDSTSLKSSRTKLAPRPKQWDDRHHLLYSQVNHRMHKNVRAYFDRERDAEGYGLLHRPRLRTQWQLDTPEVALSGEEELERARLGTPHKEATGPAAALSQMKKSSSDPTGFANHSGPFNHRHHVMFNKDNHHYHPNFREYFERPRHLQY